MLIHFLSCLLLSLSLPHGLLCRVVMYPGDPYFQELSKPGYVPPEEPFTNLTMDQLIQQAYKSSGVQPAPAPNPSDPDDETVLAELDMKMNKKEYKALYGEGNSKTKRKATNFEYRRWTNAIIPYEFISSDFTSAQVYGIKEAMQEWEDNTCLKFRPATRSDPSRIRFQNGNGCSAWLGMHKGTNYVTLDRNGCRFRGLYLHEIGHSIGLVHEHQLPKRDRYIRVDFNNVNPRMAMWFNKYAPGQVNQFDTSYEYSSVMHYGITAFSKDGRSQTIHAKDKSRELEIGRVYWKELSFADIKVVNRMYKCNKNCSPDPKCKAPGFLDKTCRCICPEGVDCGYGVKECKNAHGSDVECDLWAQRGECRRNAAWMWSRCKKSCGACPKVTKKVVTSSPGRISPTTPTRRPDPTTQTPTQRPTERTTMMAMSTKTTTPVLGNCRNKYDDRSCEAYGRRGDCDSHPKWTRSNCPRTCNSCPGSCINNWGDGYCEEKAIHGWCKSKASWMKKNCFKACKLCKGDVKEDCRDTHSSCKGWAKAGYCLNSQYTAKHCRKSCRFC